jgi:hypothetical protein
MSRWKSWLAALVLAGASAGCATVGGAGSAQAQDTITPDEIAQTRNASNAYDLVLQVRPLWLQVRGGISTAGTSRTSSSSGGHDAPADADLPVVYVNGQRFGNAERLREIDISQVRQVQFLSAAEATTKYGQGHQRGVIELTRR